MNSFTDVKRNAGEAQLTLLAAFPALADDGRLPHEQRSPRGGGAEQRRRERLHHHDGRQQRRGDHDDDELRRQRQLWRRWGISAVRTAELRLRVSLRPRRVLLQRVRGRPVQGGVHQLVGRLERAAAAAATTTTPAAVGVQSPGGEMILGGRSVFVLAQRVAIGPGWDSCATDETTPSEAAVPPPPPHFPIPLPSLSLDTTPAIATHPFVVRLNTFTFRASIVPSSVCLPNERTGEPTRCTQQSASDEEDGESRRPFLLPRTYVTPTLHRNTSSSCDPRPMTPLPHLNE